jgi:hypothetical protein
MGKASDKKGHSTFGALPCIGGNQHPALGAIHFPAGIIDRVAPCRKLLRPACGLNVRNIQ